MISLAGKHHGNRALEQLCGKFEIEQVSRIPSSSLRVKVKIKDSCLKLKRTRVNILDVVFVLKEFEELGSKYFINIVIVDSNTNTNVIFHHMVFIGMQSGVRYVPRSKPRGEKIRLSPGTSSSSPARVQVR
ncbi:hypothetical protein Plhal710r2_c011g0050151 [Plasmopara halstedii]